MTLIRAGAWLAAHALLQASAIFIVDDRIMCVSCAVVSGSLRVASGIIADIERESRDHGARRSLPQPAVSVEHRRAAGAITRLDLLDRRQRLVSAVDV